MIYSVVIFLEQDKPDFLEGVQRIDELKFYDRNGEEVKDTLIGKLFENKEVLTVNLDNLKKEVAKELGIDLGLIQFDHE